MSDCTLWTGPVMSAGYGITRTGDHRVILAHRLAFISAHGPIPPGLQIDHLCRNKLCVNPAHLEAVTQQENIRRQFAARQECDPATHCRAGHEWTEANTRVQVHRGRPRRVCRKCMVRYQREYRLKLRVAARESAAA